MRKKQARARAMWKRGILAIVPTAAEFKANPDAPIMTHRYATQADGQFLTLLADGQDVPEGASVVESYNADERYDAVMEQINADRAKRKAEREAKAAASSGTREQRRNEKAAEAIRKQTEANNAKLEDQNAKALAALKASSASGTLPTA